MKASASYSAMMLIAASAERDSNYYGTYTNPNLQYDHYWADSKYVLQDLGSFEKLYVKYENCAWSSTSYNYDGCSQGSDNEDYWWIGMRECKSANVAYSLYGVLPGDNINEKKGACTKATFINSFFTLDGLYSFASASNGAVDADAISSYCNEYDEDGEDGEDGNNGNENRVLNGGDDDNSAYSYTTGCSSVGTFTVDTFYGQYCNGASYLETTDTLDDLNESLENMNCAIIYSSDGSIDYATQLLTYSQVCSIDGEYNTLCPDPHGLLKIYEYNFAMAQKYGSFEVNSASDFELAKKVFGTIFFAIGIVLIAFALLAKRRIQYKLQSRKELRFTPDVNGVAT